MTGPGGGDSTNERAGAATATSAGRRPGGSGRVSDLPARLYAARMRTRSRRRRLAVTLTVTACLLALVGYLVLWHTSLIAVSAVKVQGAKSISTATVLDAAQIPAGSPMAALDPAAGRPRGSSAFRRSPRPRSGATGRARC